MKLYQKVKVTTKQGEYIGNITQILTNRKTRESKVSVKILEIVNGNKEIGESIQVKEEFVRSI